MSLSNLHFYDFDLNQPVQYNMINYGFWELNHKTPHNVIHLPDVFCRQECIEIMKLGNASVKNESTTSDGVGIDDIRRSYNSWISPNVTSNWLYKKITDVVKEVNETYFGYELTSLEHLQYTIYNSSYSGKYESHIDRNCSNFHPNSNRKLSFSLQLSDPKTYEGGGIKFYTHSKDSYLIPEREMGSITFFPSHMLHEVEELTKGTRIVLVGWVSGPEIK